MTFGIARRARDDHADAHVGQCKNIVIGVRPLFTKARKIVGTDHDRRSIQRRIPPAGRFRDPPVMWAQAAEVTLFEQRAQRRPKCVDAARAVSASVRRAAHDLPGFHCLAREGKRQWWPLVWRPLRKADQYVLRSDGVVFVLSTATMKPAMSCSPSAQNRHSAVSPRKAAAATFLLARATPPNLFGDVRRGVRSPDGRGERVAQHLR